jgi:putative ABC transport system substrate-binding protein
VLLAAVTAQPRGTVPLVGVLDPGASAVASNTCITNFQQGLRDLGYMEGQHIAFAYRSAENQHDQLPALATELMQLNPDVLWTYSIPGVRAAKQATTTIPIVTAISGGGLVEQGLIESLVRPGG